MKTIVYIVIAIVMFGAANANAEVVLTTQSQDNVRKYAEKSIPDVTAEEIEKCYDAVVSGGEYQIKRRKVKITCSEEEMIVRRRLF